MADQPATPAPSAPDYRNTVFLPATDFPMKAGLPQLEAKLLARWEEMDLYKLLRATAKGREKFVLHDGPPYANGHLHMGTALNKILKDVINRSQQMLGKDAPYVPGWTATACRSNGRSSRSTARRARTRTRSRSSTSAASAASSRSAGSTSSAPSSSGWVCWATGTIPTPP